MSYRKSFPHGIPRRLMNLLSTLAWWRSMKPYPIPQVLPSKLTAVSCRTIKIQPGTFQSNSLMPKMIQSKRIRILTNHPTKKTHKTKTVGTCGAIWMDSIVTVTYLKTSLLTMSVSTSDRRFTKQTQLSNHPPDKTQLNHRTKEKKIPRQTLFLLYNYVCLLLFVMPFLFLTESYLERLSYLNL